MCDISAFQIFALTDTETRFKPPHKEKIQIFFNSVGKEVEGKKRKKMKRDGGGGGLIQLNC